MIRVTSKEVRSAALASAGPTYVDRGLSAGWSVGRSVGWTAIGDVHCDGPDVGRVELCIYRVGRGCWDEAIKHLRCAAEGDNRHAGECIGEIGPERRWSFSRTSRAKWRFDCESIDRRAVQVALKKDSRERPVGQRETYRHAHRAIVMFDWALGTLWQWGPTFLSSASCMFPLLLLLL